MTGVITGGGRARPAGAGPVVFLLAFLSGALGALAALPAWSQPVVKDWDRDYDEDVKPWKEIEAKIPAHPKPENLLPFAAGAGNPHRYFIDGRSVSIGKDGVVRYTLVVKTAGGVVNTTYEGMRCDVRQQKYYAVGQENGGWARARAPQWRRIEFREINNHHGVLYSDFLCYEKMSPDSVKDVLQLLKHGPPER
ncbi:MAG TPA: CNP1-like family protein [Burkholderiales bacterium]|nr:CNP1-like family protein [Burkholderiales bacterium]